MAGSGKTHTSIADELWQAICEGRRLDAHDLLRDLVRHETFTSLDAMHRLYPDSVPPITNKDRAS